MGARRVIVELDATPVLPGLELEPYQQWMLQHPAVREVVERLAFRLNNSLRRKPQGPRPKRYPRRRHGR